MSKRMHALCETMCIEQKESKMSMFDDVKSKSQSVISASDVGFNKNFIIIRNVNESKNSSKSDNLTIQKNLQQRLKHTYNIQRQLPEEEEDADGHVVTDKYDPTYAKNIHNMYRHTELKYVVNDPNVFINMQLEINDAMRKVLIDWLTETIEECRLSSSTFHTTVHLVDLSLKLKQFTRKNFQLLGCTCLLIAAKLDEVSPPLVENLVSISDFCFDDEALISMEQTIIKLLEFDLIIPTRVFFARRYSRIAKMNDKEFEFVLLLLELTLLDLYYYKYPMSQVAAGIVNLALQIFRPRNEVVWKTNLIYSTGYSESDLKPIVIKIRSQHWDLEDSVYQNILKKYERSNHYRVGNVMAIKQSDLRFHDE